MTLLQPDEALTVEGSLLSEGGLIVASYDLEQSDGGGAAAVGYRGIGAGDGVHRGVFPALSIDYATASEVHVINGMGVTLGDSIIGLSALAAVRRRYPDLRMTLYRPACAPRYVEALYALAEGRIAHRRTLPWPLARLRAGDLHIDVGNHLFWPAFMSMPMIDFFLAALGVDPAGIEPAEKANRWLADLALPALPGGWQARPYVLFCPTASTPVRSMPPEQQSAWVERLAERFSLPVLGFGPLVRAHPAYVDVQALSPDTAHFLAWVKHASYLLTVDTAAVHVAAGFDVPTTAFFTTVAPELRVRDYPHCVSVPLPLPALRNVQSSSRAADLALVQAAYRALTVTDAMFGDERGAVQRDPIVSYPA
ncbi:ADP-heptose--LPS heptosyltransferase [Trinickia caryophylli]|uniref:ADP-heptose:LPS heptosyltransferase n=1 Tax=Trinickia caryophylli TaxID=28094 RepID=A0A1X7ETA8_TRICW|nr:ADP-heptose--LPS heptosyltransferase [Trinickia caryophylli]PMS12088.1 ADP-heptose--LPS heptosyltransferase [Trinickia caryophylli]TRX18606.1 glycosyltransferase family 9 protein [Trinickia caryophylli]WQE10601.1 ADP-heptose--LPS heptosyltransferase [Trinickia caryophylli]SMF39171.1 ADP-heptose:LPS heptosyltransferase [Trinickia caryophylli]GLU32963.1 hypothetical protein Busp01_28050 [Trinickia caryophylli]